MSVKERLKKYLNSKNISMRQFTIAIGVSSSYVNNINKSIQPDKIDSITNQYPDLNTGWLLTGEGEMLKSKEKPIITLDNTDTSLMPVLQFIMEERKTASSQIDGMIREMDGMRKQMDEMMLQNRILAETVNSQAEILKKRLINQADDVPLEENVKCADVSGSDLQE